MATQILVPTLGESVTEATIAQWFKKAGDAVKADEPLVELETDKVTVEVPAPTAGVLVEISAEDGATVEVGALLGSIDESAEADEAPGSGEAGPERTVLRAQEKKEADAVKEADKQADPVKEAEQYTPPGLGDAQMPPSPAAQKLLAENDLSATDVDGSGKRGQVLKEDVVAALRADTPQDKPAAAPAEAKAPSAPKSGGDAAREERVRMTRLRQTIAKRLKDAQNVAAMLTTFNEVDMSAVMALRSQYKELFEKKHGQKLGFMGFFVKAAIQALKDIPAVNAEIEGDELVYKNYYNIGVAVGTEKGLVVPVVRDADKMSIAEIEKAIGDFGQKARKGDLGIEEMQGGTFTISNGGVYGSLMSTPILNAPQSGILGMHKIQQRPMAIDGKVEIRPMMYLALTYDHRIVDGREAVTFLVRLKEAVEDPQRLVLDL